MPRKKPTVLEVEIKYCCDGDCLKIKFKAGRLGNEEHPGICAIIFCQAVKDQLISLGIIPEELRRFPTVQSLLNDCGDIILGYETVPPEDPASGDCFCFLDHRGTWRCICEN